MYRPQNFIIVLTSAHHGPYYEPDKFSCHLNILFMLLTIAVPLCFFWDNKEMAVVDKPEGLGDLPPSTLNFPT